MSLLVAVELPLNLDRPLVPLEDFDPIGSAIRRCRSQVRAAVGEVAGRLGLIGFEPSVSPDVMPVTWNMAALGGYYLTTYLDGVLIRGCRDFLWTPERPHAWFR